MLMKTLYAASQSLKRFGLLLSLTKISSCEIIKGLEYHLVKGFDINAAAALAEVKQPNLQRALNQLEKVSQTIESIKELDFNHLNDINKKAKKCKNYMTQ